MTGSMIERAVSPPCQAQKGEDLGIIQVAQEKFFLAGWPESENSYGSEDDGTAFPLTSVCYHNNLRVGDVELQLKDRPL